MSSTPTSPQNKPSEHIQKIWKRAYKARTKDDLRDLYKDWAASYDDDHDTIGFFAHRATAETLARYTPFPEVSSVLDAGAGTGAAGIALAELGYRNLTAIDLSQDMLDRAAEKGVYRDLRVGDLDLPLDDFPCNQFDAAILVGVFSYGQAPAHAIDEIIRVVKPGGVIAFTMRTDFFEEDAMGVRSRLEEFERSHAWKQLTVTDPQPYLPGKDPDALFRVWCYRVLETKTPPVDEDFAEAVREALGEPGPVHRIDHAHIWNSTASRLYDRYTECPGYYLTDCEVEILDRDAGEILGESSTVVELGCGSARKIGTILESATQAREGRALVYVPVDVSEGAVEATTAEVTERFGDRVEVTPRQGRFEDVLASIPVDEKGKLIVFFGGSLGNFETIPATISFLRGMRDRMGPNDRFVVGIDLHKDEKILREAYEAGEPNRSFFLNMLRRINQELGGNLDLGAFQQDSPYEPDPPHEGIESRCVQFQLRTCKPQDAYIQSLHMEVHFDEGDAIQSGTSRKFRREDIAKLGALGGLKLTRQWFDERGLFSLNEFTRDDSVG